MLPEPDGDYFFKLIISLTHPPDSERAMEQVKEAFDAIASDYDAQRRGIVRSLRIFTRTLSGVPTGRGLIRQSLI